MVVSFVFIFTGVTGTKANFVRDPHLLLSYLIRGLHQVTPKCDSGEKSDGSDDASSFANCEWLMPSAF